MVTEQFRVPGVSCPHCVHAVQKEVGALAGVSQVEVDLTNKIVTVVHDDDVDITEIVMAIKEAGYDDVTPLGIAC
ncbi:heavy-metal-associated domain-containing protein [uncultured Chloroflexus sp.]|uniref:heavy-metal-associated domain-containing protein n=1 Tax=uncultured Chloroflexus sp. TaxID=214040 RepID=UPI002610F14E|nr:heavy metal-associated domain-containing protein [uncultured Chloroflexus sp.]